MEHMEPEGKTTNTIQIIRKKHFCGCLVSYQLILGYDVEEFKDLIKNMAKYYKDENKDLKKEEFFNEEFSKIRYLTIKNGEVLNIDLDKAVKTIFVCNNVFLNDLFYPKSMVYSCYPLVISNQILIDNNMKLELTTKGGFKKIEFILKKIENGSDENE